MIKKISLLSSVLFFLLTGTINAQYVQLYDFSNISVDPTAPLPNGALTLSTTGDTLYGMTQWGGKFGWGSIFYITTNGSVYDTLLSFDNRIGGDPYGSLILSGKKLYGMTFNGGASDVGVIFSVNIDGTAYDTLFVFGDNDNYGGYPTGTLTLSKGVLYGMAEVFGLNNSGVVFRINTDGTHFDTLHSFGSIVYDGSDPQGSLTLIGDTLFGMTYQGGKYGNGSIFRIDTNGSNYDTLRSFGNGPKDGYSPYGDLTRVGNVLYGTTSAGAAGLEGNIFSINRDGTGYDTLHDFGLNTGLGTQSYGSLTLKDTLLYGMAYRGGALSDGVIFSMKPDGTGYDTLYSFGHGPTDGEWPTANVIFSGDTMFGMTPFNVIANSTGSIFRFHPVSPVFSASPFVRNNVSCYGGNNGSAVANPSSGITPYTYMWSDSHGQTTDTATGLSAGNYTVTVTDAASMTLTASISITQPGALTAGALVSANVTCYGQNEGVAFCNVTGGVFPFTYSWTGGAGSTTIVSGLTAGSYTITVTDYNGCTATSSVSITQPSAITATTHVINDTGSNSGAIAIHPSGGTGPYTYLWEPGNKTTDSISGLAGSNYTCTVTDANGCTYSTRVIVYNTTGVENVTNNTGQITVYPNPSTGKYTIEIAGHNLSAERDDIQVYNLLGETIYPPYQMGSPNFIVDLSAQPAGVYFLKVISNQGYLIGEGKLVIQK